MISLKNSICISITLLLASCTDRPEKNPTNDSSNSAALDIAALVASQMQGGQELASFLDQGEKVQAIDVLDGASQEHAVANRFEEQKKSGEPIAFLSKEANLEPDEFEKVLQVNQSLGSFEITLNELRAANVRKDQSIASLTRLNEELIAEIQRLRGSSTSNLNFNYNIKSFSDNHLENLQKEIAVLKKNLLQKSQEIDGLKLRNDQFQSGIDSLQPRVASQGYAPSSFPSNPRQSSYETIRLSTPDIQLSDQSCSLEFDAVVTLLNGKSKEVFYTEFFLLSQSFPDLLFNGGIFIKDFPGVGSFEELWAKARKSPFAYPEIYKRIRNLLLEQIEKGKGYRVRTDIDGFANFVNLPSGSYYLIGTAPVGKIGAVWNVPVRLKSGTNKTSLTLANANWSE
jgi:hypothetical protein